MKYAILAAGEGSRLAQEGIELPKPLVKIQGEAMIDRLIRIFHQNEAEEIAIITNNLSPLTQDHIRTLQQTDPTLRLIVKTTPSSMHSFYELKRELGSGRFCLTTVDTIFREEEFSRYISALAQDQGDGIMAVTDFIDDEKPLYVSTSSSLGITGFHDSIADFNASPVAERSDCKYISGGIYGLDDSSFAVLDKCIQSGMSRMRNFQRQLVAEGLQLKAYPFTKILDVDHAHDIETAEAFLMNNEK